MIYLKLFYNFLIVGLFSFGGAYSAIPLIVDVSKKFDCISEDMIADFIAISESTPGPVAVNLATFVGTKVAGIPGAIVATFAEILPAFVIILVLTLLLKKFIDNKNVVFVLGIIRPCIAGLIMSVGLYMLYSLLKIDAIFNKEGFDIVSIKSLIILIILIFSMFIYKKITKKRLVTIKIIILGAIFGIAINYLL